MTSSPFTTSEYKTISPKSQIREFESVYGSSGNAADNGGSITRGSSYDKQKFVCFYNPTSRKFMYIELYKVRYSRMRRSIVEWANLMNLTYSSDSYRRVMITLTYKGVNDWQPNDITDYVKSLRARLGTNLVTYAWVAELQRRGAIHYHMIVIVKRGTNIPRPDKSGMWNHGSTSRDTAKSVFYLVTYLGKEYQKNFSEFPHGARCFGIGVFEDRVRNELRFCRLKDWEQKFMICRANMDWDLLKEERDYRRGSSGWVKCYVTTQYDLVQNVYDGYLRNGMIETSCQDGSYHDHSIIPVPS